jgi:hypothetical protein
LHPIAYVRQIVESEKKRVRFEAATKLDCYLGDQQALGENAARPKGRFGLGTEAKFTSDMDDETTYLLHRNQIARIVELGNERCESFAVGVHGLDCP